MKVNHKFHFFPELIDFLNAKKARDSYYSTAYWLNPTRVASAKTEGPFDTVFLGCDLFFDIDIDAKKPVDVVKAARDDFFDVLEYIGKKNWEVNYMAFSGSKGFHISVKDPLTYSEGMPSEREAAAKLFRKEVAEDVASEGLNVDFGVLKDIRRITRIPYTYNSKSGLMCVPISGSDLEDSPKAFIKRIPKITYGGRSPLRRAMTELRLSRKSMVRGHPLIPRAKYYTGFSVSSTVTGTKRHVFIFEPGGRTDRKRLLAYLKKHDIAPIYSFTDPISEYLFSPVALDPPMIIHIMKRFDAKNLSAFKKYGHALMRIGDFYSPLFERRLWTPEKKPVEERQSSTHPLSKAHMSLVGGGGRPFCGGEQLIVRLSRIKP